ncbi:MAG: cysteine hydrolase family protein [Dehalococcoidia bacterium]|nr:MAG: cysteine hydrolase family protein [Dehalococcoidia bacterium]
MGDGVTADSRPYLWPWHGEFAPRRTGLLVIVDGTSALPNAPTTSLLLRVVSAAAAAGVAIGELPDQAGTTLVPDGLSDFVVARPHIGGFSGTDLDSVLRRRRITDLVLAGFPFELGADCTMRQANDLGYECLALTDCCSGLAPDTLAGAISSIQMSGGIFGVVAESAAVLDLFAHHEFVAAEATSIISRSQRA